jgi:hypothetical protein
MESFIHPIASSAFCTKQDYFRGWHPFWNWMRSHIDIPVNSRGIVNLYIDDFFGLMVDIDNNAPRLERAPLLALIAAAREVAEIEPLPCDDIEAQPKLIAEAGGA